MQILGNDTSAYHGYNEIHKLQALSDSLNPYYNNNTDWQGVFYQTTYNQTHNLSFSGKPNEKFDYKINAELEAVYIDGGGNKEEAAEPAATPDCEKAFPLPLLFRVNVVARFRFK